MGRANWCGSLLGHFEEDKCTLSVILSNSLAGLLTIAVFIFDDLKNRGLLLVLESVRQQHIGANLFFLFC